MSKTKLSSKYQLVIPKDIRRRLKLTCGTEILLYPIDDERVILVKQPKSHTEALSGLGKDLWKKLGGAEKYLRNEREVWGK